ncbi:MAG TPA: SusD/RagB family nutrient-binding outer membrane lipoprotein, partial [Niastella sp.]|nr:SusD/RagB family nutrient-binding outer membrane lipoprotein [Niastella sp.]
LLAEAAQRGWIIGTASDYYNKGVKAAILQLNQAGAAISQSEADNYLNAHPYEHADGLEMINTQYWVATFADWNETWCNWRRSGYPHLTEIQYQGTITIGSIPRRLTYPLKEASVNPQSYKEAVERIAGGDKMTSRVWWDK